MAKGIKRREFEPRQSLKDAGVIKTVAEIDDSVAKSIIIEHDQEDKQKPIMIPITREWYGNIRENFKTMAEKYFKPDVILQLDRERLIVCASHREELREQEKRAAELKQKSQQARTKLQQPQQQQKPIEIGIEIGIVTNPYGDWEHPITVTRVMFESETWTSCQELRLKEVAFYLVLATKEFEFPVPPDLRQPQAQSRICDILIRGDDWAIEFVDKDNEIENVKSYITGDKKNDIDHLQKLVESRMSNHYEDAITKDVALEWISQRGMGQPDSRFSKLISQVQYLLFVLDLWLQRGLNKGK